MSSFLTFEDDTPGREWETVRLVRNVYTGELAVVVSSTDANLLSVEDKAARDADIDAAEAAADVAEKPAAESVRRAPQRGGRPPGGLRR